MSTALATWRDERAGRLDELFAAHRRIGGTRPGRRAETQQINWALVLRLAAEFQGFARDLHSLGAETFCSWAAPERHELQVVLRGLLASNLVLDRGNAHSGALGADFGRFGIRLWPELRRRDRRTADRQRRLEELIEARNAIAHAQLDRLASLAGDHALTLETIRRWRRSLDALAGAMDAELSRHLGILFGRQEPW